MASSAPSADALASARKVSDLASLLDSELGRVVAELRDVMASIEPFNEPTHTERCKIENLRKLRDRYEAGRAVIARIHVHDVDGQLELF
jgi:hypothetical protein